MGVVSGLGGSPGQTSLSPRQQTRLSEQKYPGGN